MSAWLLSLLIAFSLGIGMGIGQERITFAPPIPTPFGETPQYQGCLASLRRTGDLIIHLRRDLADAHVTILNLKGDKQ